MQLNNVSRTHKNLIKFLLALFIISTSATGWAQDKNKTNIAATSTQQTSKAQAPTVEILSEKRLIELSKKNFKKYPTIQKLIELNSNWEYYKGNSHIESSFENQRNIIVEGNLTIDGNYIESMGSNLIVIGNLTANNLLSNNTVYVTGNLTVNHLLYIDLNDWLQVDGKTKVNTFIQNSEQVYLKNLSANNHIKDGAGDFDLLTRSMHEDLVIYNEKLSEDFPTNEATFDFKILPDFFAVRNHLINSGLEFFRTKVADKNLHSELIKAISHKTKPDELIKMADNSNTDILVKAIIASRLDIPLKAQEILFNTNNDSIVHSLARNSSTQADFLLKISRKSPDAAQYVARNPSCPSTVINELIKHENPEFRWTLAFNKKLESSIIEKLANDEDITIRTHLFNQYSGFEFSNDIIEANLKVNNSDLKKALIERNPNLTLKHYQTLLAENDNNLTMAIVKNINDSSMFLAHKKTTPQDRELLLYEIAKKTKNTELKMVILTVLPIKYQQEIVKTMSESDQEEFQFQLASHSSEKNIIMNFANDKNNIYYKNLASNYYLPELVQKILLQKLPSIAEVNASKNPEQQFEDEFQIFAVLLENSQTDKTNKSKIIEFCSALNKAAKFCRATSTVFGLTEKQIKSLLESKDKTLAGNLIANFNKQIYAPESAIKLMHFNNAMEQTEFEKIKSLSGDEFWNSLAQAPFKELKRIAAINHNTPIETLLELRKSNNPKIAYLTLINPKYPLNLLKNEKIYFTDQLRNPNYNKEIVFDLLQQTSLDTSAEIRDEMRTWLWLNDKKLKAKSLY